LKWPLLAIQKQIEKLKEDIKKTKEKTENIQRQWTLTHQEYRGFKSQHEMYKIEASIAEKSVQELHKTNNHLKYQLKQ
jgi:phage shock protein A